MINFFLKHYPPPYDGGGHVFFSNIIANIDSKITLFTHKNAHNPNLVNVKFLPLSFVPESRKPSSGIKLYWSSLLSFFYFFRHRVSLSKKGLHLGQIWPYGMAFYFLKIFFNINYVVYILGEELSMVVYNKGFKYYFIRHIYRKILFSSSHIFAYSTFVRDNIYNLCSNSIKDNISILSSGIDIEDFTNRNIEIPSAFNCNDGKVKLFTLSRHIERKGIHNLIHSLNLLKKSNENWHQYIGGEGPQTSKLKNLVEKLNLNDYVTFLGRLSESEIHGCYRNSDIFILPNLILENGDADGCPIVFIEASAYALPCIGGNVPGTKDAIENGKSGFILNSKDHKMIKEKIEFLITNEEERKNMGANAKSLISKNYKWKDRFDLIRKVNDKISNK